MSRVRLFHHAINVLIPAAALSLTLTAGWAQSPPAATTPATPPAAARPH